MRARSSAAQKEHYEAIHDEYESHYYDPASMAYRDRFMYDVMFAGLDLNGRLVADLAAGSGYNSLAVRQRFPRAAVLGFDISSKACEAYRTLVGSDCVQLDLTLGADPGIRADVAMVVGGLHHCVADLDGTFKTVANLLRPGGLLLAVEPNREFILECVRDLWYRMDRHFEAGTERAISHGELKSMARGLLEELDCHYMGGPAYFLILNSLVTRVPVKLKQFFKQPLFWLESAYNLLPGKRPFPYFVSRWRRC